MSLVFALRKLRKLRYGGTVQAGRRRPNSWVFVRFWMEFECHNQVNCCLIRRIIRVYWGHTVGIATTIGIKRRDQKKRNMLSGSKKHLSGKGGILYSQEARKHGRNQKRREATIKANPHHLLGMSPPAPMELSSWSKFLNELVGSSRSIVPVLRGDIVIATDQNPTVLTWAHWEAKHSNHVSNLWFSIDLEPPSTTKWKRPKPGVS